MGDARIRSVFFDLGLCLKAKVFWCAGPRLRRCPLMVTVVGDGNGKATGGEIVVEG